MHGKPPKCPKCGSDRIAKIVYGLPDPGAGLEEEAEAGRIILAGCRLPENPRQWHCHLCGHELGKWR